MQARRRHLASITALASSLVLFACSGSTGSTAAPAADAADAAPETAAPSPDGTDAGAGEPTVSCAPPPSKSSCGDGAWVRGVAHFDPSKLQAGSKPVLRVVLRHGFALLKGEEAIGGRLHGYASVAVKDPTKGEVPFAIDMCDFGTSMWSEENGAFHLVLMLDENGDNDLDDATSNEDSLAIGMPTKGELVKMVDVDVSCHTEAACLDVKVDCTSGADCTTIQPVKTCKKTTPGCNSDSAFCN